MSRLQHSILALLFILFSFSLAHAAPGIMLEPLRIEVPDGQRYAKVTILNQSDIDPVAYNISTLPLRMKEDGSLFEPEVPTKREVLTSSMVRFSPRTAKLEPSGRQSVRIAIRKPPNLPDGEYMTYMRVGPIDTPESVAPKKALPAKASSMTIEMKVGMRIPIIIYQGASTTKSSVSAVRVRRTSNGTPFIDLKLDRTGNRSSYVGTSVYSINNGQKKLIASKMRTVTYFPLTSRTLSLPINDPEFKGGTVLVELNDFNDKEKKIIDSKEFPVGSF